MMSKGYVTLEFFNPDEPITDDNPKGEIKILYSQDLKQAHAERILNNSRGARLKEGQGFVFKEGTLIVAAKKRIDSNQQSEASKEKTTKETESEKPSKNK